MKESEPFLKVTSKDRVSLMERPKAIQSLSEALEKMGIPKSELLTGNIAHLLEGESRWQMTVEEDQVTIGFPLDKGSNPEWGSLEIKEGGVITYQDDDTLISGQLEGLLEETEEGLVLILTLRRFTLLRNKTGRIKKVINP